MPLLSLLGADMTGSRSIIQWIFVMFIFMFVMPKLYFYQIFSKVEATAFKLEAISKTGQETVLKKTKKYGKDKKSLKATLDGFIDFFLIPPVSVDPFGIMKKIEHVIDNTEDRFKKVAFSMVPKADSEKKMDVYMGLQAAVTINMIAKIVRHYVETAKKFKNLQFAMILQMQLPMIEKMVESELKGLDAFLEGKAIGDGIGPMVVGSMLKKEGKEITPEALAAAETHYGRKVTFIKAKGPGGRLGKIGDAVQKTCNANKITRIITVDAAQKMEGEKTGSVAEGVGVAMGGPGVQRSKIEEIAVKKGIPLDAIAIKMSPYEAISPMPLEVVNALDNAKKALKTRIEEAPKGSHVIVVGVGNTCGVPNTGKDINKALPSITKEAKKQKRAEEEENKKGWFTRKTPVASFFSMVYGVKSPMDLSVMNAPMTQGIFKKD